LSILGTWAGPNWKPIMNIRLVLTSIVSLMGQYPIQNEPGFENVKPDHISSIEYNLYIIYHTYSIAIIDVLEDKYQKWSNYFKDEITLEFKKNYNKLKDDLLSYQQIHERVPVSKQIYFMENEILDFNNLLDRFNKIKN